MTQETKAAPLVRFAPASAPHQKQLYPDRLDATVYGEASWTAEVWLWADRPTINLDVELPGAKLKGRLSPEAARDLARRLTAAADHIESEGAA